MDIKALFEKYEDEYLNYRADPTLEGKVHDFIIFKTLVNFVKKGDLVGYMGHEEIYLNVDAECAVKTLSEDVIVKLIRCGLRYSEDHECFVMFV